MDEKKLYEKETNGQSNTLSIPANRVKHGVLNINYEKSQTGISCLLCGSFIPCDRVAPLVCNDCKALWKKLQRKFTTKVGSMVVANTKEQDLLGFYGRVLRVRTGEALVEFPMVKGKRVVTWLKDEDYIEVE